MGLIESLCFELQGCFLVSSPAANAESSPHLKTESLVSAKSSSFFFCLFQVFEFSMYEKFIEVLMPFIYLFVLVQVLLGDSFYREREYRRAIVRDCAISLF